MNDFNAYHRWLGIPVSEQPANLYRLLGLSLFEPDAEVIRDAAERQISHVRKYAQGKYKDQANQLLNELSRAQVVLLDKKTKRQYDKSLPIPEQSPFQYSSPAASRATTVPPTSLPTPKPSQVQSEFERAPPSTKQFVSIPLVAILVATIFALAASGFFAWKASSSHANTKSILAETENASRELELAIHERDTANEERELTEQKQETTTAELVNVRRQLTLAVHQRDLAIENVTLASAESEKKLKALKAELGMVEPAVVNGVKRQRSSDEPLIATSFLLQKNDKVNYIAFSSDGTRILSQSRTNELILWDAKNRKKIAAEVTNGGGDFFSKEDHANVIDNERLMWSKNENRSAYQVQTQIAAFSPNGMRFVSKNSSGDFMLRDAESGRIVYKHKSRDKGFLTQVTFSPDGRLVASGNYDGRIEIRNAQTGQEVKSFKKYDGIDFIRFSPDGQQFVVGHDSLFTLWNTADWQESREELERSPEDAVFNLDGTRLLLFGSESGNSERETVLWNSETGRAVTNYGKCKRATFSNNGLRVAFFRDGNVNLHESQSGSKIAAFPMFLSSRFEKDSNNHFAFSPDSGTIVVMAVKKANAYDAQTGKLLFETPLRQGLGLVTFSSDSSKFAACDGDVIKIFSSRSGAELGEVSFDGIVQCLEFSPDGTQLIVGTDRSLSGYYLKPRR